ncbi:hypothetical protein DMN50_34600, partial [Priestia megaterium]
DEEAHRTPAESEALHRNQLWGNKRFSTCRPLFVPSLFLISRYRDFSFYTVILVPNKMER